MSNPILRVGHSPDPDDAFMFHALTHDKIDTGGLKFVHQLEDIETLNQRARRGELEISAISLHAYPHVADKYALLSSGCSMGDKYGPMVVAREPLTVDQLKTKRIAIPGTLTTAFLTLKLLLGDRFEFGVVPFDQILDKVEKGEYDAGLIIHEGQLTYASHGLKLVVDLGVWWQDRTGLPLPLGGNVVRRDLGDELLIKISKLLRQSIRHGLQHRREAMEYALKYGRDLNMDLADRFVGMYVNDWTIDYGERGRAAVRLLLGEGAEKGFVPALPSVDFVDDGE